MLVDTLSESTWSILGPTGFENRWQVLVVEKTNRGPAVRTSEISLDLSRPSNIQGSHGAMRRDRDYEASTYGECRREDSRFPVVKGHDSKRRRSRGLPFAYQNSSSSFSSTPMWVDESEGIRVS